MDDSPTTVLPAPWMTRVLVANVVAQIGIVVTGGLVRLTGSGLGCPTWPECVPGSFVPVAEQAEGFSKVIEFGNRLLTGVVGLTALTALVVTVLLVRSGRSRRLLGLGGLPLLLVVAQAVIGGITVLTQLHPVTVAVHFVVSMGLVAVSVLLLERLGRPDGPAVPVVRPEVRGLAAAAAVVAVVVLALGTVVTGSGPHSGDADTPARFGFDPRSVSWMHADSVMLFIGLVIGLVVVLHAVDSPDLLRRRAHMLLGVTLAQGLVGAVQYLTGLPEALVLAHMLGAALLVVALTLLLVSLWERTPQTSSASSRAARVAPSDSTGRYETSRVSSEAIATAKASGSHASS